MDFSWVRQLAEESNQHEQIKQEQERIRQEEERLVALATVPFVEKLYMLIQAFCEEFNKYSIYPDLRISMSKLSKRSKAPYPDDRYIKPDEVAYFTFTRKSWMFGIRGSNGLVEFIEFPVTDGAGSLSLKLDELGADGVYTLNAKIETEDGQKKQVVWTYKDEVMDGPKLISLCQHYFGDFVKRTND